MIHLRISILTILMVAVTLGRVCFAQGIELYYYDGLYINEVSSGSNSKLELFNSNASAITIIDDFIIRIHESNYGYAHNGEPCLVIPSGTVFPANSFTTLTAPSGTFSGSCERIATVIGPDDIQSGIFHYQIFAWGKLSLGESTCGETDPFLWPYFDYYYTNNGYGEMFDITGETLGPNQLLSSSKSVQRCPDGGLGQYAQHNTSSFSATNGCAPLPVELSSFSYRTDNHSLVWETKSEINNDYFVIEQSISGYDFDSTGIVQGSGTSNQVHQYEWLLPDQLLPLYFRLKQVDFDGSQSYSNVIFVPPNQAVADIAVFPNPVTSQCTVLGEVGATISVYDHMGHKCAESIILGQDAIMTIDFNSLQKGLYLVSSSSRGKTRSVVVLKM